MRDNLIVMAMGIKDEQIIPDFALDAGSTGCGELSMLIFERMKTLQPGQTLEVVTYDLAAEVDIPAWCRSTGNLLLSHSTGPFPQRFFIQKKPS